MTDGSAFKRQVRARMAETGEKYTVARRMVLMDAAIRSAVQRSIERAVEVRAGGAPAVEVPAVGVGVSAVEVDLTAERVHVIIRAARPDLAWGFLRAAEAEGVWRESAAEQLRGELEELTRRRVRLDILQVPSLEDLPGSEGAWQ